MHTLCALVPNTFPLGHFCSDLFFFEEDNEFIVAQDSGTQNMGEDGRKSRSGQSWTEGNGAWKYGLVVF